MPSIAIIGASSDPAKFGNKAVKIFMSRGYTVYPVNPKDAVIEGQKVYKSILEVPEKHLDMISLYLPPPVGLKVIGDIAKKGCKELWLNPGAESPELVEKAESLGLTVIQACSIVSIGASPNDV
ncbi:CoA-binding protein [bacterium]|nr:CoA-binding protein [bacterium]NBW99140.1 CoA-binding protein [bacterium]NBX83144.1 CoA-binding protein [bacterium]